MLRVRLWNEELDDVLYKNFKSRDEIETFFSESYFLYGAEVKESGNLLPIGSKRQSDKYVEWHDE
jgi:hypothetical protein